MNIGQIKRFVNDSLIPLNRLIGSPEDDENKNTLFGIQKKMLISGGGGVKHVYRGITSGAGNVTLPAAVNMDKTVVLSTSKGSAGYVAARGTLTLPKFDIYGEAADGSALAGYSASVGGLYTKGGYAQNKFYLNPQTTGSISGGTTSLTVKEYSARLVDENTIYCDGPVEWQVIEYN